jgi:hypothetical protein
MNGFAKLPGAAFFAQKAFGLPKYRSSFESNCGAVEYALHKLLCS